MRGRSVENDSVILPSDDPAVALMCRVFALSMLVRPISVVSDNHCVLSQRESLNRRVSDAAPRFDPCTVRTADPVEALLIPDKWLGAPTSADIACVIDPI